MLLINVCDTMIGQTQHIILMLLLQINITLN